jgi:hypothetical protein
MSKLVLITQNNHSKNNPLLSQFHRDMGSLMRIRGFQLLKYFDDLGHLVALDWFSFSRNQKLFKIQFDRPDLSVFLQIEPFLEQILSELSIFQLVDIFVFDELGIIEPYIVQIKQQIITIFSSKYPAIATVNQNRIKELDYLKSLKNIQYQFIDDPNNEQLYLDLIGELYDH